MLVYFLFIFQRLDKIKTRKILSITPEKEISETYAANFILIQCLCVLDEEKTDDGINKSICFIYKCRQ